MTRPVYLTEEQKSELISPFYNGTVLEEEMVVGQFLISIGEIPLRTTPYIVEILEGDRLKYFVTIKGYAYPCSAPEMQGIMHMIRTMDEPELTVEKIYELNALPSQNVYSWKCIMDILEATRKYSRVIAATTTTTDTI